MRSSVILVAASLCGLSQAVHANDTSAELRTGGLVFVTNETIRMASEDLSISAEQIKVVYKFQNISDHDQHVLVAFPLPDITGTGGVEFEVGIPTDDVDNIFGFKTMFDGKPVKAELHQYAFANNIDQSAVLRSLGVPLVPFGPATSERLNALSAQEQQKLISLGLAEDSGVDTPFLTPIWTLRSTYSWEAVFAAHAVADVVHTYVPSVGGTAQTSFLPQSGDSAHDKIFADYQAKYCVDANLVKALRKSAIVRDGQERVAFTEAWISYVWSTGANWAGPIGRFTLTIDKGDPKNLVSFCGAGVKKIGATTFQMTAEDWSPETDELNVLILKPLDLN